MQGQPARAEVNALAEMPTAKHAPFRPSYPHVSMLQMPTLAKRTKNRAYLLEEWMLQLVRLILHHTHI